MSYLYHNKGFYTVNNKNFFNKLDAILECNANPGSYIKWNYHNEIFGKYRWDVEPPVELDMLYKERALQLRNAYDHLALFFSGGVDSWYILRTFIKYNIKLDEIYIWGAFEAEEKEAARLGFDRTPGYYTREAMQAKDLINKLVQDKKIKVNIFDWTRHMLEAANNKDWFWTVGSRFDPSCMVRPKFHKIFREHYALLDKGKTVGFIYGTDKPRLLRDDNTIYFAFLDTIMTTGTTPTNDILGETWENDEYFYWSPNLPELPIKQCHLVANWLKATNQVHLITHLNKVSTWNSEDFFREVSKSIYPDWDLNTWQVQKPTTMTYNEVSSWFINGQYDATRKWEESLDELERAVGSKWFNKNTVKEGLTGSLSPLYKITNY